ncbi:MAG TPA: hypothetical protein VGY55_14455 [Pirellulales bacterium]|nr:hypothetical protein [Pirellulales bacterium]
MATFVLVLIIQLTRADEVDSSKKGQEAPDVPQASQAKASDLPAKDANGGTGAAPAQTFDPAVVSVGQAAFERSCTTCHDAARALERTKDLAGWRATVRRMATKRDSDVASEEIEPIAVYLASRNATASGGQTATAPGNTGSSADESSVSAFATLSPLWRGGNSHVQNPDFGPLAFFGASWQSKVVSARITLCITCHGVQEPAQISRIDPLEVAVRVDLSQFLDPHVHGMKGGIDAGRFVIPFGAFSAQVNPGLYYTVSPPLIFNMGERLFNADLGFPVLPMPDADEGVNLNLDIPLGCCRSGPITATIDTYAVNGLQGNTDGIDFIQTRSLLDNNNKVSGGGRLTFGDPNIRFGTSVTAGRFDDPNTSGFPGGLDYIIYGFDVQAHYEKLIRFQAEFARRESDRAAFVNNGFGVIAEAVQGYYIEAEARPYNDCHVSFLVRYDSQSRRSLLPPPGSSLPTGTFDVERLTVGINFELWRQSLLMIDLEHWLLPEPNQATADVVGARYTITF